MSSFILETLQMQCIRALASSSNIGFLEYIKVPMRVSQKIIYASTDEKVKLPIKLLCSLLKNGCIFLDLAKLIYVNDYSDQDILELASNLQKSCLPQSVRKLNLDNGYVGIVDETTQKLRDAVVQTVWPKMEEFAVIIFNLTEVFCLIANFPKLKKLRIHYLPASELQPVKSNFNVREIKYASHPLTYLSLPLVDCPAHIIKLISFFPSLVHITTFAFADTLKAIKNAEIKNNKDAYIFERTHGFTKAELFKTIQILNQLNSLHCTYQMGFNAVQLLVHYLPNLKILRAITAEDFAFHHLNKLKLEKLFLENSQMDSIDNIHLSIEPFLKHFNYNSTSVVLMGYDGQEDFAKAYPKIETRNRWENMNYENQEVFIL